MKRVYYFCRYCGGEFFAREFWKHMAKCEKNPKNSKPGDQRLALMGSSVKSQRKYKLKAYGLTEDTYNAILAEQDGRCAICRSLPGGEHHHWNQRFLAIDHDHATNSNRGLLCTNCNHGIGKFKEDPALLLAAIDYLRRFKPLELVS